MKIYVDKREQKSRSIFSTRFPLEYEEKILEVADVAAEFFDRLYLIEIKIGSDMFNLNHVLDQISRMSEMKWSAWEKHLVITRENFPHEEILRVVKRINGPCFMGGIYLHIRESYEIDLIDLILDILRGKYAGNKRVLGLPELKHALCVRWLACVPGITPERAIKIVDEIKKTSQNVGLADLTRELLIEDELGQCVLDRVFGLTKNGKRLKIVEKIKEYLKTGGV